MSFVVYSYDNELIHCNFCTFFMCPTFHYTLISMYCLHSIKIAPFGDHFAKGLLATIHYPPIDLHWFLKYPLELKKKFSYKLTEKNFQ